MPRNPYGLDLEASGSRFNLNAGLVFIVGEHPEAERAGRPSEDIAAEVIRDRVGEWIFERDPGLGQGQPVSSGVGRGAEGWAPVIEWWVQPVVGALAWESVRLAAKGAKRLMEKLRRRPDPRVEVSRGMAGLLAIEDVLERYPGLGQLEMEAIEEPSAIAGIPVQEVSYVGLEPWLVFLVDEAKSKRFVVAVNPDGQIVGRMDLDMNEFEKIYWQSPWNATRPTRKKRGLFWRRS